MGSLGRQKATRKKIGKAYITSAVRPAPGGRAFDAVEALRVGGRMIAKGVKTPTRIFIGEGAEGTIKAKKEGGGSGALVEENPKALDRESHAQPWVEFDWRQRRE